MTLKEVIAALDSWSDDHTIYATRIEGKWQDISPALVSDFTDGNIHQTIDGNEWEYLLEVELAKEAVDVYKEWRHKTDITDDEKLEAVIFYAENDGYLPVDDSFE